MNFKDFERHCDRILEEVCKADCCQEGYVEQLYELFTTEKPSLQWVEEQLEAHFPAAGLRPEWLDEPDWPFLDGTPMTFVTQFQCPNNECPGMPDSDDVFFLFCGKEILNDRGSYRVIHRLVYQKHSRPGTFHPTHYCDPDDD